MCHRFRLFCSYGVLATLNRSLIRFFCIWHCLLTRNRFVQCQQHLYVEVTLQCISGLMAVDFEQITVSIRLFFTWVLRVYIILDKDCHILYVLSLNSPVGSHIIGVHLSRDQATYDFMMDADLYDSFSVRLRLKSF